MSEEKATPLVRALKSIVFTSDQPEALAEFYRQVLCMPFEKEKHKGVDPHWACQLGDVHYAIHHSNGFWLPGDGRSPTTSTFISFTIEDLEPFLTHLAKLEVEVVARRDIGPMKFIAFRDPDGRYVSCGTPWPTRGRSTSDAR